MTRSYHAPEFEIHFAATSCDAMIDKFSIELGDFLIVGTPDQVQLTLLEFSQLTLIDPDWEIQRLFQATTLNYAQYRTLRIIASGRGRGSKRRPALVFSGDVHFHPMGSPPGSNLVAVRIRFELDLNLVRYCQAQPLRAKSRQAYRKAYGRTKLVMVPKQAWYQRERPLLYDTNLIIGHPLRTIALRTAGWKSALNSYLEDVASLLVGGLFQCATDNRCEVDTTPNTALHHVEVFWERSTPSPRDFAISFGSDATRVLENVKMRPISIVGVDAEHDGLSYKVGALLPRGVKLNGYPKTDHRFRLEYVFESRAISASIGRRTSSAGDQLETLINWIERIVEVASGLATMSVNEVMKAPRRDTGLLPPHVLLLRIVEACPDAAAREVILSSLVETGTIRMTDNSCFREIVKNLARAGVIERRKKGSSTFAVTHRFARAANALSLMTEAWRE